MAAQLKPEFEDTRIGKGRLKNWKPKAWRVEYERIVAYSVMGWSNKMIAKEVGYTPVHISNILQLDEAEQLRQVILAKMRERTTEQATSVAERLEEASRLASKRLVQLLEDDDKFATSPFAMADRALEVLKGSGYMKKPSMDSGAGINVERAVILNAPASENLLNGLSKADQAIAINAEVK